MGVYTCSPCAPSATGCWDDGEIRLVNVALVVLAGAGITLVLVRGSVFDALRLQGPRQTREFFDCPLCTGVWIGVALGSYSWGLGELQLAPTWLLSTPYLLGIGCITAVVALVIHKLVDLLDALTTAAWVRIGNPADEDPTK